ncbi:hypothetical protein XNC3_160029 [Xenorhabdus nematophila F1]|nr:hypothetical protein XNC3_160029 [Xenorhabdus nematophila F1]
MSKQDYLKSFLQTYCRKRDQFNTLQSKRKVRNTIFKPELQ